MWWQHKNNYPFYAFIFNSHFIILWIFITSKIGVIIIYWFFTNIEPTYSDEVNWYLITEPTNMVFYSGYTFAFQFMDGD